MRYKTIYRKNSKNTEILDKDIKPWKYKITVNCNDSRTIKTKYDAWLGVIVVIYKESDDDI